MTKFDIMDACKASAKDFCDTLLLCLEDDGIFTKEDGSLDEDFKKEYKEYLDSVLEMHYNTDIGEQGENISKYLDTVNDEADFKVLFEQEHNISEWLKENGYTDEDCIGACFEPIDGHKGREMDFEYKGNIDDLDINKLSAAIAENVIDDRFSVRVSVYDEEDDEEDGEANKNLFCVEVWLDD
jgi:hypothetical protein